MKLTWIIPNYVSERALNNGFVISVGLSDLHSNLYSFCIEKKTVPRTRVGRRQFVSAASELSVDIETEHCEKKKARRYVFSSRSISFVSS